MYPNAALASGTTGPQNAVTDAMYLRQMDQQTKRRLEPARETWRSRASPVVGRRGASLDSLQRLQKGVVRRPLKPRRQRGARGEGRPFLRGHVGRWNSVIAEEELRLRWLQQRQAAATQTLSLRTGTHVWGGVVIARGRGSRGSVEFGAPYFAGRRCI